MLLEMVAEAAGEPRRRSAPRRRADLPHAAGGVEADGDVAAQRGCRQRRHGRTELRGRPAADVRLGARRDAVCSGELPPRRRAAGGDPATPGSGGGGGRRRRGGPARRARRRRCRDHRRVRRSASSDRHDRRGTGRPRRRGHPPVHQRDDRRAEGSRAPPSPPHLVHPVDGRVPRRRRRRGATGQRARLPRRRHVGGAQLGVRRATHLLPARLRHGRLGAGRPRAGDHPGDGRADDARTHPRRDRAHAGCHSPRCATSPTAAGGCRSR